MGYWHLTLSSETRMPVFPSEVGRRRAVCTVVRVLAEGIVLFCIVDDHVHVVVVCPEERLPRLRSGLWHALSSIAEVPLSAPHARRVRDRRHLERLVRYFLSQTDHHGLSENPALYSGSCYQDLVGARRIPGWEPRLFRALPRWRPADLHRIVGLASSELSPMPDDGVRAAGAAHLVYAASMSTAADPRLRGKQPRVVLARAVAAQLGASVGVARPELSWALGITASALRRLEERPLDAAQLDAARLCVSLIDRAVPEAASFRLVVAADPGSVIAAAPPGGDAAGRDRRSVAGR